MSKMNREFILSVFLGFVVLWFGVNEVLHTSVWVGLVPKFLGSGGVASFLVLIHGIALILFGLMLVFNFYRRLAAFLLVLMFLEILFGLFYDGGLSAVAVRDIGLFGMALALVLRN